MAAYISFQPSDYFNTVLYTGNQPSSNPVTGVGFQPDIIWVKDRDATPNHVLFDSVRGITKSFYPNETDAEVTDANGLTAFGADGFTVADWSQPNTSGDDYVSWNWKTGTTSGATFGSADITPTDYSINTTTGQGVYKYSGNGSSAQTVAHALGAAPDCVMIKRIENNGHGWQITNNTTALGFTKALKLESNGGESATSAWWNDTAPTSDVVNIGGDSWNNLTGKTFMMYCFRNKRGFFKTGIYTGNGLADGPFVYTGFRPACLIRKKMATENWAILDNKRLGYNPKNYYLFPDTTQAESDLERIDILSNGFKLRTTDGGDNGSGHNYFYMAWAEFPFVSSNSIPTVAR